MNSSARDFENEGYSILNIVLHHRCETDRDCIDMQIQNLNPGNSFNSLFIDGQKSKLKGLSCIS